MQEQFAPYRDKFGPSSRSGPARAADRLAADRVRRGSTTGPAARADVWIKANGMLPDDPLLHVCIVA